MSSKQKNFRSNMPTNSRKGINIQQRVKNPVSNTSIKDFRKTNSRRKILPAINKKSPIPIIQTPNPLPPTIKVHRPPIQLPPIKEHVIQQNLTQKPSLKCKSPRPGSVFSRSNTLPVSEHDEPIKTRHPLQRMNVGSLLSESARNRLKRLFNKLDTDHDGYISHLLYSQVQRCLPSNLSRAQLTFFRVFYDIISDTTFFSLQEFYATAIIVEMIAKQDSKLWNTYLDDVDFNYYHSNICQLIEKYNNHAYSDHGLITYDNLLELILQHSKNYIQLDFLTNQLEYLLPNIQIMQINRLDFIALLPAIIYIQSCFDHEQKLFRFRENSLLDLHIRQALVV